MFFFLHWKARERIGCHVSIFSSLPTLAAGISIRCLRKKVWMVANSPSLGVCTKSTKICKCMYVCDYHRELLIYYESQLVGQAKFQLANEVRIMELKQTISPSLNQSVQRSMLLWCFWLTGAHLAQQDKAGQDRTLSLSLFFLAIFSTHTVSYTAYVYMCMLTDFKSNTHTWMNK